MTVQQGKQAPVVAVLNMKGGVGKTTVSAHLMRVFFERLRRSTLLIDLDPQFNLTQTLLARQKYDGLKNEGKTVASIMEPAPNKSLFKVTDAFGPPPSEVDLAQKLRWFTADNKISIDLIAGNFDLTKYCLVEDVNSLQPVRQRFIKFIENSRVTRDLICIDCNPSSSFLTLCALMSATHVLVPVRLDRYSILGLELLDKFIAQNSMIKRKPKMIVLLNGMKSGASELAVENQLRSHERYGPMVLGNNLRFSELLTASDKHVGFATDRPVSHVSTLKTRLVRIVDELKEHIDAK